MQVSLSLVNSPMLPETTIPRLKPPLSKTFCSLRNSTPARTVCLPLNHTMLSTSSPSVSRRFPGALSGAPIRAKGNKPSSEGVITGVTEEYGNQTESYHPPTAPFPAVEAPAYCGSSPESRYVGTDPPGKPAWVGLKLASWGVSVTWNLVNPPRRTLLNRSEKRWVNVTTKFWFKTARCAPFPGYAEPPGKVSSCNWERFCRL